MTQPLLACACLPRLLASVSIRRLVPHDFEITWVAD